MNKDKHKPYYLGLMSGTSMDAVDTAIVDFSLSPPKLIAYQQYSITADMKAAVRNIGLQSTIEEVTRIDYLVGEMFASAVNRILSEHSISAEEIIAIGCHGQTILHLPDSKEPRTLQIGDPNIIAERTGIATTADFRRMDLAAGGQGAPLAPAFHDQVFRKAGVHRAILNIGGIANISVLSTDPGSEVVGFDTGPGNGLLDDWCQQNLGQEMDENSQWAATGKPVEQLLDSMLSDPYFTATPPKSTGRDYFNKEWIHSNIDKLGYLPSPEDVQATLFELTRKNICDAIQHFAHLTQEVYVCGGGAHNKRLMQSIRESLDDILVEDTNKLSIDPDAVEAVTFAWLAKCRIEEQEGNNPSITGARSKCVLGGLYIPPTKPG